uniref:pentatricopeptide repeat-containing protein 2, mitochondrial-like n=1 Tax=Vespula vulgaris TaxID=7454 RepID=UPI00213FE612|nr:pentatricopeptide repeat-containing protein 2, mitochondrial-like [Vespula vulgaris]
MALNLRFLRFNLPLIFKPTIKNNLNGSVHFQANRFILTNKSIGMNGYEYMRSQISEQFTSVESSFRTKMKEIVNDENSVIFTEDLKAMAHLVSSESEDLDLFVKMIYKFNSQNKELRFGNYVFGPVIMRAFNFVDRPDLALSTFLDPNLTSFYDQNMSYTALMTLLYNHEMYKEIRQVFDMCKNRNSDQFPRFPVIITAAACYRENTPESYSYLLNCWRELSTSNFPPIRKVITFLAGLALKQNSPEIALELLSLIKTRYIDSRCLKILTYSKLNRFNDVMFLLKKSLEGNYKIKETYFSDVIATLEVEIENSDENIKPILQKLITLLKTQDYVQEETLESHLITPVEYVPLKHSVLNQKKELPINSRQKRIIGLKDLI